MIKYEKQLEVSAKYDVVCHRKWTRRCLCRCSCGHVRGKELPSSNDMVL